MGNFYFNYTLKGRSSADVARALKGRRTLITPKQNDSVVVYVESDFPQDMDPTRASELSAQLSCPVFCVTVHDDSILIYKLFRDGECVDEYDSSPDYFSPIPPRRGPVGGNAPLLCKTFGRGSPDEVERILRKTDYTFEYRRHQDLVAALEMNSYAVGLGYDYVRNGDIPDFVGLKASDLLATD